MEKQALHDTAGAAGTFQVAILAHLDRPALDRLRRDRQQLINTLVALGFTPSIATKRET